MDSAGSNGPPTSSDIPDIPTSEGPQESTEGKMAIHLSPVMQDAPKRLATNTGALDTPTEESSGKASGLLQTFFAAYLGATQDEREGFLGEMARVYASNMRTSGTSESYENDPTDETKKMAGGHYDVQEALSEKYPAQVANFEGLPPPGAIEEDADPGSRRIAARATNAVFEDVLQVESSRIHPGGTIVVDVSHSNLPAALATTSYDAPSIVQDTYPQYSSYPTLLAGSSSLPTSIYSPDPPFLGSDLDDASFATTFASAEFMDNFITGSVTHQETPDPLLYVDDSCILQNIPPFGQSNTYSEAEYAPDEQNLVDTFLEQDSSGNSQCIDNMDPANNYVCHGYGSEVLEPSGYAQSSFNEEPGFYPPSAMPCRMSATRGRTDAGKIPGNVSTTTAIAGPGFAFNRFRLDASCIRTPRHTYSNPSISSSPSYNNTSRVISQSDVEFSADNIQPIANGPSGRKRRVPKKNNSSERARPRGQEHQGDFQKEAMCPCGQGTLINSLTAALSHVKKFHPTPSERQPANDENGAGGLVNSGDAGTVLCPAYGRACKLLASNNGELCNHPKSRARHLAVHLVGGSQCERCHRWFGWRVMEEQHIRCCAGLAQMRAGSSGKEASEPEETSSAATMVRNGTKPKVEVAAVETMADVVIIRTAQNQGNTHPESINSEQENEQGNERQPGKSTKENNKNKFISDTNSLYDAYETNANSHNPAPTIDDKAPGVTGHPARGEGVEAAAESRGTVKEDDLAVDATKVTKRPRHDGEDDLGGEYLQDAECPLAKRGKFEVEP